MGQTIFEDVLIVFMCSRMMKNILIIPHCLTSPVLKTSCDSNLETVVNQSIINGLEKFFKESFGSNIFQYGKNFCLEFCDPA